MCRANTLGKYGICDSRDADGDRVLHSPCAPPEIIDKAAYVQLNVIYLAWLGYRVPGQIDSRFDGMANNARAMKIYFLSSRLPRSSSSVGSLFLVIREGEKFVLRQTHWERIVCETSYRYTRLEMFTHNCKYQRICFMYFCWICFAKDTAILGLLFLHEFVERSIFITLFSSIDVSMYLRFRRI